MFTSGTWAEAWFAGRASCLLPVAGPEAKSLCSGNRATRNSAPSCPDSSVFHPPGTPTSHRWHFRWWAPAERFAFLQPWSEAPAHYGGAMHPRESTYAPPRPVPPKPLEPVGGGLNGGVVNGTDGLEGTFETNGLASVEEEAAALLDARKALDVPDISESV